MGCEHEENGRAAIEGEFHHTEELDQGREDRLHRRAGR